MGFKFNPTTGDLDLVNKSGSSSITTSVNIPAGTTVSVDSVAFSTLKSINYFINIYKSDFTQARSFNMSLMKLNLDVFDSVYSIVGNSLNAQIVSSVIGPNAIIQVTNNEAFDLTFSFNKTVLN